MELHKDTTFELAQSIFLDLLSIGVIDAEKYIATNSPIVSENIGTMDNKSD